MDPYLEVAEIRNRVAPILLYTIKQKMNPSYGNQNGIEQKYGMCCSITEFVALFPQAKTFPMRINSATLKPKIQHSKKLYEATFVDIRSLDYLFKQIDSEWDVMFNWFRIKN